MNQTTTTTDSGGTGTFLGHPIGLWVLFTTEMWERFCYYGMRAFLVMYLYFTVSGDNPGFGWSESGAYELYGWFTGLVYLFPLLGGFIADRFIGQHKSVLYGGILIALGEICLFMTEFFREATASVITLQSSPGAWLMFMGGLALIIIGTGFFKPCISVMVGQLYKENDNRRDVAFTIFYMGINVGALLAPFVAGTIAEKVGWQWGFLAAAIGMILGLITYSLFRPKYLSNIGDLVSKVSNPDSLTPQQLEEIRLRNEKSQYEQTRPMARRDIDRIAVILVLSFFCIAFWAVFEQAGSSLNTFAKKETNRVVLNAIVPAEGSHPFIANEDEREAISAIERARYDMNRGGELDEMVKGSIEKNIAFANWALKRATHAREQANLPPITIEVPTFEQLLAQRTGQPAVPAEEPSEIVISEADGKPIKENATLYTFPATWYQSVNPIGIVLLAPLFAWLWGFLARKKLEPSTPVKFGVGLVVLSIAYLFMVAGGIQAERTSGNAAATWLLMTYLFCTMGELCLSPVGLSMVSRLAPARFASLLMGAWFLSSAIACYLSGKLAALFGSGGTEGEGRIFFFFGRDGGMADYFLVMAIVPMLAGVAVFILAPMLRRMMHEE